MTFQRSGAEDIPAAGLFLYDRDCGFCQRAVAFAQGRLRTRTAFAAWQRTDLSRFGLTPAHADDRAWVVLAGASLLSGGDAVAHVLLCSPRGRPIGRALRLPLLRAANRAAYRWVAAHRHRLPGGTASCALPSGSL
ncbi:thiol-disulfide oxidoreductase DCC family protein [Nocardiopsis aegyptia]|uniref:thiol-disulfide oxidoreductase DCC family protein n=1 Tax=Nocardiopsis aegyptia TaxID=220378 RepID=UPI00366BA739